MEILIFIDIKFSRERELVLKLRVVFLEFINYMENKSFFDVLFSNVRKSFIFSLDLFIFYEYIDSLGEGNDSNILFCRGLFLIFL